MTNRGPVWFVEAMFPGYLLAKFVYSEQHRAVEASHGIRGIVHFGDRLATLPESAVGGLRCRLHPAARLVASPYPVLAIWEANIEGAPESGEISLDAGPDRLLVTRRELERVIERLTPGEYGLLRALALGASLADACQAAAAAEPRIDLEAAMARFVAGRVVTDFHSQRDKQ